jgi:hypothetical protein
MPQYTQGSGTYNAVGNPASYEASAANGFHNATPYQVVDPSTWHPPCPMDGSQCNAIGSQSNGFRCIANGHQWTYVNGSLQNYPYVFDNKVSSVLPTNNPPPVTLG